MKDPFYLPPITVRTTLPARFDALEIRRENAQERFELIGSAKTSFKMGCKYLELSRKYANKADELFRRHSTIKRAQT